MSRVYNFSAGPAVLPEEVLKEVADEMMDYNGTGMSVMEMSHRSAAGPAEKLYTLLISSHPPHQIPRLNLLLQEPDVYKRQGFIHMNTLYTFFIFS